jgi:glucose-1-phosphate adenylyltransferase
MHDVVTVILGGGQGARLWPLTRYRAKPAVPFGGKFRLIDIPISNSLHAGIANIYVLTQFNSASLHHHIAETYRFDTFRGGYVNILAAEQGVEKREWYQGTADAVRQNLAHVLNDRPRDVLVLSGDQLYLMRVADFVERHRRLDADLSIAVKPVARADAKGLGILRVDGTGRIVEFVEKPQADAQLDALALDRETLARLGYDAPAGSLLASMGIYVFKSGVLSRLLTGTSAADFGKEVIPGAIADLRVYAWPHTGYWRDIGTIPSFHEASIDLTLPLPPLNLYDPALPIYTHGRYLPGTKINRCDVEQSILCEGSIITEARIAHSIVGIRAVVRPGSELHECVVMGARFYEPVGVPAGDVPLGIGRDCVLRRAIVDLDARIGDGARLVNKAGVSEYDGENVCIRGGVIVVPRGAVIPPGTEI